MASPSVVDSQEGWRPGAVDEEYGSAAPIQTQAQPLYAILSPGGGGPISPQRIASMKHGAAATAPRAKEASPMTSVMIIDCSHYEVAKATDRSCGRSSRVARMAKQLQIELGRRVCRRTS